MLVVLAVTIAVRSVAGGGGGSGPANVPWERWDNSHLAPPPPPTSNLLSIAFGSCSSSAFPSLPHFDVISSLSPSLLLLLGDNVYGDCEPTKHDPIWNVPPPDGGFDRPLPPEYDTCRPLVHAYDSLSAHPSFLGFTTVPVYTVLDDHDSGVGDSSSANPHKDVTKSMMLDFFQVPAGDERRGREGLYFSRRFGDVEVVMLDVRTFSTPRVLKDDDDDDDDDKTNGKYKVDPRPTSTFLGPDQWDWLTEIHLGSLAIASPPRVRVIASGIMFFGDGLGWEHWGLMPHERSRLLSLTNNSSPGNPTFTILLSGDRHVGGIYNYTHTTTTTTTTTATSSSSTTTTTTALEVLASSLTHTTPYGAFGGGCTDARTCDEGSEWRVGDLVRENHFGWLEFEREGGEGGEGGRGGKGGKGGRIVGVRAGLRRVGEDTSRVGYDRIESGMWLKNITVELP